MAKEYEVRCQRWCDEKWGEPLRVLASEQELLDLTEESSVNITCVTHVVVHRDAPTVGVGLRKLLVRLKNQRRRVELANAIEELDVQRQKLQKQLEDLG